MFWFVTPRTPPLWQRWFFLVNCLVLRRLLASARSGVVKTFRYVPQTIGALMDYAGPIDLDALVDLDSLAVDGAGHYTFFAFPISTVNQHRLPSDLDAQRYIAAVQSVGVPIGIWLNSPIDDTGYAAVTHDNIPRLHDAITSLTQFSDSYASDLCDKLFRNAAAGGT